MFAGNSDCYEPLDSGVRIRTAMKCQNVFPKRQKTFLRLRDFNHSNRRVG
jgi:hypothetical protein